LIDFFSGRKPDKILSNVRKLERFLAPQTEKSVVTQTIPKDGQDPALQGPIKVDQDIAA
jgi:hypothetical protein